MNRQKITAKIIILFISINLIFPNSVRLSSQDNEEDGMYLLLLGGLLVFVALDIYENFFDQDDYIQFPEKELAFSHLYYLATEKELKKLKSLKTPESVNKYTSVFWKRFDPTPETPLNEFKILYLKRFDYVNEKYSLGWEKGWKSDRGRVYLLYGKPHEIDYLDFTDYEGRFGVVNLSESYAMEIWYYDFYSVSTSLPTIFNLVLTEGTVFIFMDLNYIGTYEQVYSTATGEKVDTRVYRDIDFTN